MIPAFCLCEIGLHTSHLAHSSIRKKAQSSHQDTVPSVNAQPQGSREQMLVRCDTVLICSHTNHFNTSNPAPVKQVQFKFISNNVKVPQKFSSHLKCKKPMPG